MRRGSYHHLQENGGSASQGRLSLGFNHLEQDVLEGWSAGKYFSSGELSYDGQEGELVDEDVVGRRNGENPKAMGINKTRCCVRGHWKPSEDAKLKELVNIYGPQNWNLIAEKLEGRSGLLDRHSMLVKVICYFFMKLHVGFLKNKTLTYENKM